MNMYETGDKLQRDNHRCWQKIIKFDMKDKCNHNSIAVRTELCLQIANMSDDALFELCQDLASFPNLSLTKPISAPNCKECKEYFGPCVIEIDYEQCKERFWTYAARFATEE